MLHGELLPQAEVTEGIVEYLLLVAKVEHDVTVKLVSQGRPDGLDVSDVIANTGLVSFTLPDEESRGNTCNSNTYTDLHTYILNQDIYSYERIVK